jgi:hypothetical protein
MHIHSFYIFKINFNIILPRTLPYSTRSHSRKCHHKNSLRTILLPHFFNMTQQSLVVQGFFIIEDSRSHSDTPHSIGLLWTSDRPDAETSTWQHATLTTDINVPGSIRTRNPSKRVTANPRLRPHGHQNRLSFPPYLSHRLLISFLWIYLVLLGKE